MLKTDFLDTKVVIKLLFFFGLMVFKPTANALPPDTLALSTNKMPHKWGLSTIYRFKEISTSPRFATDLGVQLLYAFDEENSKLGIFQIKRNSLLLAYSLPFYWNTTPWLRWTWGLDSGSSKISLLSELQSSLYVSNSAEFVVAFRAQNTGFSVENGDGAEFENGSISRFWHLAAELNFRYALLNDLHFSLGAVYRHSATQPQYSSNVLAHASMQWFWGD